MEADETMEPDENRYRLVAGRAAAKVIDGDAIVIDTVTGLYFSLAGAGETAWTLLSASHSVREVAAALAERYDTGSADVVADVQRLAEELVSEHLLERSDDEVPPAASPDYDRGAAPYSPPTLTVFRDMQELLAFDPPLPGANTTAWKAESHEA